jgi:hypothetical protein
MNLAGRFSEPAFLLYTTSQSFVLHCIGLSFLSKCFKTANKMGIRESSLRFVVIITAMSN